MSLPITLFLALATIREIFKTVYYRLGTQDTKVFEGKKSNCQNEFRVFDILCFGLVWSHANWKCFLFMTTDLHLKNEKSINSFKIDGLFFNNLDW